MGKQVAIIHIKWDNICKGVVSALTDCRQQLALAPPPPQPEVKQMTAV